MPIRKTPKAKKVVKKAKTPKAPKAKRAITVNKERSVVKSKALGIATVRKAKKAKSPLEPKPYKRKGDILKSPDVNRLRKVLLPGEKPPIQRRRYNIPYQHYSNIYAPSRRGTRVDVPYLRPRPARRSRRQYKEPLYHRELRSSVRARKEQYPEHTYSIAEEYQGEPVEYMEQFSEPEQEFEEPMSRFEYPEPIRRNVVSSEESSSEEEPESMQKIPVAEQIRILERTPIKEIQKRIRQKGLGPAIKGYQKEVDKEKLIKKLKRKPFVMNQLFD